MKTDDVRNRKVGWGLGVLILGLVIYSFWVIQHRGHYVEPPNLPKWKKILRGL